ncbi:MAG: hypothetical protein IAA73_03815 [Bacteroidetes bacterium]|uniref:Uncharacterized protein n=1 Tax=Candidatus Gallipaludibacter merdavium TaxID=2840839 RepID=A0A9D9HT96_9BACT|nr:hypothetical protein [Candidatus Gallipaludibacter merdavium]
MSQDKLFLCNGMPFLPLCVLFVILWPCGVWAEASFAIGGGVKTIPFNSVTSFHWKSDVTPRVYPAQPQTFRFSKQASANASVYSNKVLQANTYRSVGGGQQVYPSVSYGASAAYSQAASASVNLPIHLGAADKWTQPQSPLSSNVQSLAAVDMAVMQKDRPVGPVTGGDDEIPGVVPVGNGIPVALFLCVVYVFVKSYRRERV